MCMPQTGLTQHHKHFNLSPERYPQITENSDHECPTVKSQVIVSFKSNNHLWCRIFHYSYISLSGRDKKGSVEVKSELLFSGQ